MHIFHESGIKTEWGRGARGVCIYLAGTEPSCATAVAPLAVAPLAVAPLAVTPLARLSLLPTLLGRFTRRWKFYSEAFSDVLDHLFCLARCRPMDTPPPLQGLGKGRQYLVTAGASKSDGRQRRRNCLEARHPSHHCTALPRNIAPKNDTTKQVIAVPANWYISTGVLIRIESYHCRNTVWKYVKNARICMTGWKCALTSVSAALAEPWERVTLACVRACVAARIFRFPHNL